MDDKQKLSDFLLIKLQECKLRPHDGAIYGEAADYIAEQLVAAGYRKQSDVVREFAKRIKDIIHRDEDISNSADEYLCDEIDDLAEEFGAEEGNK